MLNIFQSGILLLIIFMFIFIITYYYTKFFDKQQKNDEKKLTKNYMGFIFIIFGILKLYDLPKFIDIFKKYDIISKNIKIYSIL